MTIKVLTLEVGGRVLTYAAPVGDKDPMEMTLREWRAYPLLSASEMLERILQPRSGASDES